MDDKKKKFEMPKAEVVDFANDDIITASLQNAEAFDWNEGGDRQEWH